MKEKLKELVENLCRKHYGINTGLSDTEIMVKIIKLLFSQENPSKEKAIEVEEYLKDNFPPDILSFALPQLYRYHQTYQTGDDKRILKLIKELPELSEGGGEDYFVSVLTHLQYYDLAEERLTRFNLTDDGGDIISQCNIFSPESIRFATMLAKISDGYLFLEKANTFAQNVLNHGLSDHAYELVHNIVHAHSKPPLADTGIYETLINKNLSQSNRFFLSVELLSIYKPKSFISSFVPFFNQFINLVSKGEIYDAEGKLLDYNEIIEIIVPKLEKKVDQDNAKLFFLVLMSLISTSTKKYGKTSKTAIDAMNALIFEYQVMPDEYINNNLLSCISTNRSRSDVKNLVRTICSGTFPLSKEDIYILLSNWPDLCESILVKQCTIAEFLQMIVDCEEDAQKDPTCNLESYLILSGRYMENIIDKIPERTYKKYLSNIASILSRSKATFTKLPQSLMDKMMEIVEV